MREKSTGNEIVCALVHTIWKQVVIIKAENK